MNYYLKKVSSKYYDEIKKYREELIETGSAFDGCHQLEQYEDIEKWDLNCKLFEKIDSLPMGYSLSFIYLFLDEEDNLLGIVDIRPEALTHPHLKQYGGHIGYNIKPSLRNKHLGTSMLKDVLILCKNEFKLDKVLITCLKNNIASRKVILNNGGIYETEVLYPPTNELLERYWISL